MQQLGTDLLNFNLLF